MSIEISVSHESKKKNKPTIFQSFLAGSIAGTAEVLITHPLWTIKIRMQCGDSFTLNPRILYRSAFYNAVSLVPSIALQVGINRLIQKNVFNDVEKTSKTQQVFSAFASGIGSTLIRCPTELVMTQRRIHNKKFIVTANDLLKEKGIKVLYTGFTAIAIRSGAFATSFLVAMPTLKSKIINYGIQEPVASVSAGLISGVTSAILTQAFDTVNAYQQSRAHENSFSMIESVKKICGQRNFLPLFKGGGTRALQVASATSVIGFVNEKMNTYFSKPER